MSVFWNRQFAASSFQYKSQARSGCIGFLRYLKEGKFYEALFQYRGLFLSISLKNLMIVCSSILLILLFFNGYLCAIDGLETEKFLETLPKPENLDDFLKTIETKPSTTTVKEVTRFLEKGKSCSTCSGKPVAAHELSQQTGKELIVFVSLSLGKEILQKLSSDVSKAGGRLVLRGLKDNSFKAMQKVMADLQINVDIDPYLFEEYEIKHVPTFVVRSKGKSDRLSGNVTLAKALEIFKEEGDVR